MDEQTISRFNLSTKYLRKEFKTDFCGNFNRSVYFKAMLATIHNTSQLSCYEFKYNIIRD